MNKFYAIIAIVAAMLCTWCGGGFIIIIMMFPTFDILPYVYGGFILLFILIISLIVISFFEMRSFK